MPEPGVSSETSSSFLSLLKGFDRSIGRSKEWSRVSYRTRGVLNVEKSLVYRAGARGFQRNLWQFSLSSRGVLRIVVKCSNSCLYGLELRIVFEEF